MNRLQELRDLLATFEKDFIKFYEKGNKSAGTRVRKHMNDLKRKAQGDPQGSSGNQGPGEDH